MEDLIQTITTGIIDEEKLLERGLELEEREHASYRTRIKARVRRVQAQRTGRFVLSTLLNRSVFKSGDEMEIRFSTNRDAHLYIFDVTGDDQITVLVPNRFSGEPFIKAGSSFVFPNNSLASRGVRLTVSVPPGWKSSNGEN